MNPKTLSILAATLLIGVHAGAHANTDETLRAEVVARGHTAISQICDQARSEIAANLHALLPPMATIAAAAAELTDLASIQTGQ